MRNTRTSLAISFDEKTQPLTQKSGKTDKNFLRENRNFKAITPIIYNNDFKKKIVTLF
jgi:hypothetical protein